MSRRTAKLLGRIRLLLLLALFAAPGLAAWLVYGFWPAGWSSNYGELLGPTPLYLPALSGPGGEPRAWSELRGKWLLLLVTPAECQADCAHAAYLAQQARMAQGRDRERLERVMLGGPAQPVWPHAEGAWQARVAALPASLGRGGLYLVDPLGNLMLRFPDAADGKRVIGDLRRLLQASRLG